MTALTRCLAALGMTLAATAAALVAVPPVARVTDLTGTLDAGQRQALEQRLAAFEQRKGSQIAVLIVPTTAPEAIEQYSIRVAETWKLGRKGVDDGVLLLVAKDDRAMRIEVGYGLEGAVPDAIAKRIIEETLKPHFREGDFYGGINAGTDQLIHVIDGEPLPPPTRSRERVTTSQIEPLFMIGMFILIFSQGLGRGIGEGPSSLLAGLSFGALSSWILGSIGIGLFAGLLMLGFSLLLQLMGAGHAWGGSGGSGRSWGGGGGFSRGGGGGGFSGGGGGFGGGGASGRW